MPKKSYGKTKSGVEITDELIEQYVAEAEQGYDLDKLQVRRGRPLLGLAPASTFAVRLDPELRHALDDRAAAEGVSAAEVVRRALMEYLERKSCRSAEGGEMRMKTRGGIRDPLPAGEIESIIGDELGSRLEPLGFERIRRRMWVRSTKAPIREEVGIGALKGYSFSPGWSVSLDFVPHVTPTGVVKTHRTAKQHVADLGVDPLDHPSEFDVDGLTVHGMRSPRSVRRSMRRSAEATIDHATAWFDRISDVRSLLPLYEEAIERPVYRFGFENHVQHRLSYAFVLAVTSQGEAAREQLDQWCGLHLHGLTPDRASRVRSELHERLADTQV